MIAIPVTIRVIALSAQTIPLTSEFVVPSITGLSPVAFLIVIAINGGVPRLGLTFAPPTMGVVPYKSITGFAQASRYILTIAPCIVVNLLPIAATSYAPAFAVIVISPTSPLAPSGLVTLIVIVAVSYTHLTLPTNREV